MTVPADQPRTITSVGRLMMADLSPSVLRCRIEPAGGAPVTCRFPRWLAPRIGRQVGTTVRARAAMPGEGGHIEAEAPVLEALEHPGPDGLELDTTDDPILEEIAARHGVTGPPDARELYGKWPGDPEDGFEAMIRDVRQRNLVTR